MTESVIGKTIVERLKEGKKSDRLFSKAMDLSIYENIDEYKKEISSHIFKSSESLAEWNSGTQIGNYEGIVKYSESDRNDNLKFTKDGWACEIDKEEAVRIVDFLESVDPKLKEKAIEKMQVDIESLSNLIKKIVR